MISPHICGVWVVSLCVEWFFSLTFSWIPSPTYQLSFHIAKLYIYIALINAPPPSCMHNSCLQVSCAFWHAGGDTRLCPLQPKKQYKHEFTLSYNTPTMNVFYQLSFGVLSLLLSCCCCHLCWQRWRMWKDKNNDQIRVMQELAIISYHLMNNTNRIRYKLMTIMLRTYI